MEGQTLSIENMVRLASRLVQLCDRIWIKMSKERVGSIDFILESGDDDL